MDSAKLFKNGQSLAVRLPKEYRMEGSEVYIHKVGDVVMLIPKDKRWKVLQDSLEMFSDEFMNERAQPQQQKREDLFS